VELDEFRRTMNAWWDETYAREVARKDAQGALMALEALYEEMDEGERHLASEVFCEWLGSEDTKRRNGARIVVKVFRIRRALPALQSLASVLETREGPIVRDELEEVRAVVQQLERLS
jgi:hypothetical protein